MLGRVPATKLTLHRPARLPREFGLTGTAPTAGFECPRKLGVMRAALITGIGGFAGSHLADYLLAETDWQIVGCILNAVMSLPISTAGFCQVVDLRDPEAVRLMLDDVAPD